MNKKKLARGQSLFLLNEAPGDSVVTGSLLDSVSYSWLMNCEMVISAQLHKI